MIMNLVNTELNLSDLVMQIVWSLMHKMKSWNSGIKWILTRKIWQIYASLR